MAKACALVLESADLPFFDQGRCVTGALSTASQPDDERPWPNCTLCGYSMSQITDMVSVCISHHMKRCAIA